MKRAHAVAISILVAAAISLGIATAFQATADPPAPAGDLKAAADADFARESQRLDAIQRRINGALKANPEPTPRAARVVTVPAGPATTVAAPATPVTAAPAPAAHRDDHAGDDDHHSSDHTSDNHHSDDHHSGDHHSDGHGDDD